MKNSIQLLWEKFRKNRRFNETVRCLIPAAVYGVIYLTWFFHLEDSKALHYTEIHTALDDKIPFLEIFVIPYFGWFIYCAFFFFYFLLKHDIEDYFKNAAFFFSGMTLFLIISSLWPNIQYLRPAVMPRDNIFTAMVAHLYLTDTPTNLWPDGHAARSSSEGCPCSLSSEQFRWARSAQQFGRAVLCFVIGAKNLSS